MAMFPKSVPKNFPKTVDFFSPVKSWPQTGSILIPTKQNTPKRAEIGKGHVMKKRWMKSIIETSKKPAPALPFQRQARRAAGLAGSVKAVKTA